MPSLKATRGSPDVIYSMLQLPYMSRHVRFALPKYAEEPPMRAEAEKLAEAIRDSLALLRRHL